MQTPRLIFHPKDPLQLIAASDLQQGMLALDFIAEQLPEQGDNCFSAGEHFIDLLSFLGCSPVINLSAADGDKFCYIELIERPAAELIYGSQPFHPRCSQCRQPIPDWERQLQTATCIRCNSCGNEMRLEQVNWKHSAGYASQFMLVHNIYLHEAIPGERLLMSLAQLGNGTEWDYFYTL